MRTIEKLNNIMPALVKIGCNIEALSMQDGVRLLKQIEAAAAAAQQAAVIDNEYQYYRNLKPEQVKKVVLEVKKEKTFESNYVTANILECVNFWNKNGRDITQKNITGELGNLQTNMEAMKLENDEFILASILTDCKTFVNSKTAATELKNHTFETGRTRSHVWVHMDGERVLLITVK